MAKRGIRKKEHERLDEATIGRLVSLMESKEISTKKAACEFLNISYSTSRLDRIIKEYNDTIEFRKKRFEQNKGKPFTDFEIQDLVTDYLNGQSISKIAESMFRSVHIIKNKIRELGLPERSKSPTYWKPDLIPDEAISRDFDKHELVWAARYNAVAEIRGVYVVDYDPVYRIFVFGKHNEFAYQPWWELGKLDILKKHNIPVEKFIKYEKPQFAYRIE